MKAVFIAFSQAYNEEIEDLLMSLGQRGFTKWQEIGGRGSVDGEAHYGSHAWPAQNHAILTVTEDELASEIMRKLRETDEANPKLGLRAWTLPVDESL
jgi:hypothetical protein